jgi:hypothetical protein
MANILPFSFDPTNKHSLNMLSKEDLPKILEPKKETKLEYMNIIDNQRVEEINKRLLEIGVDYIKIEDIQQIQMIINERLKVHEDNYQYSILNKKYGNVHDLCDSDKKDYYIEKDNMPKKYIFDHCGCPDSDKTKKLRSSLMYDKKIISILSSKFRGNMGKYKDLSFDKLILECDEMLDIESDIMKRFNKWKKSNKKSVVSKHIKTGKIIDLILRVPVWMFAACVLMFIISLYPPSGVGQIGWSVINFAATVLFIFLTKDSIEESKLDKKELKKIDVKNNRTEEELKLIFLKESFVGTICNLNSKLDQVKQVIVDQIKKHKDDKEELLRYKDMFENTDGVIKKIDLNVSNLDDSYEKISEKKADLNATLDKYIGSEGYIAQKEKELNRLKIAQKLSARMEKNFNETLEITKNVDVLTDTIIPGIKKLMSYKIPELIEKVQQETDIEKIFLDEKTSMLIS